MASQEGFKALQEKVQSALVSTTRSANRLAAEDLSFQRTVNPSVADDLDDQTTRLLELSSKLLNSAAAVCGQGKLPPLEDADDVDLQWRKIVDLLDTMLERTDRALDEFTGVLKRKDAPAADNTQQAKKPKTTLAYSMRNANMAKPQLEFEQPVDNNTQWKPILTKKPHGTVGLDQSLVKIQSDPGFVQYRHPYETEILQAKYPAQVYQSTDPVLYKPIDSTKAIWVDSYEGVLNMLGELKKAKEIAIDLEHHDYRSYTGLLSLMQISTRDQDWIVDTLKPWRHRLEVLNEVFADPSIVKVFHGARMDIIWLQRDLGLYINGLFDTYFAADILGYPQRSLAYLLKRFVDFDADKKYQMADWRIRPLPEEMFYYARSDTHYLLYIYDMIRNEVIKASDRSKSETDFIAKVVQRSREQSLSRYEGASFDAETGQGPKGWFNILLKNPLPFSGAQFAVYKALWKWRDERARSLDESTGYVLPNSTVADIARYMPPDAKALHSLIPNHAVIAKRAVNDIWALFQEARTRGANEPSLLAFFQDRSLESVPERTSQRDTVAAPGLVDEAQCGRMERSQLYGNVPPSTMWESKAPAKRDGEYVLLPWQRLLQAVTANRLITTTPVDVEMVDKDAAAAAEAGGAALKSCPKTQEKEESANEEFTLRAGVKRKKTAGEEEEEEQEDDTSSEEDSDSDADEEDAGGKLNEASGADEGEEDESDAEEEIGLEDEEAQRAREKAERKAAKTKRRAARRAEKKAQPPNKGKKAGKAAGKAAREAAAAAAASQAEEKQVPFDYGKASTVLHANRNGQRTQGRKTFDPYSKTGEEGPKGARKAPPLHGGRSATFKK
ncbi:hypothetical protein SODALDRAFT_282873 [Sodiomyces alkalinus F11]|uniref:HRDC domain-containing protein n=1 Tax=Sodiomyces alkalinus (strain CBS 110278 / VKM F-3762 / F11) TaxID=1314773 RepID=A0A3N2PN88_SODAK|nr:hypothetical protein SODALDRAFT_282873 [Sodiomyces alkalinus F11]ROT35806.1 hypothetical protein SODALDRAFT_282873 [Sodiomyces alkalinus F11]